MRGARIALVPLALIAFVPLLLAATAHAGLAEAEAAYARGERREAGRLVREYIAGNPDGARSARVAALLARTAASPAEALGRWDEVIALDPDGALAAEAHWAKGMHSYSAGLYVGAAREFELLARDHDGAFDEGRALLWLGYAQLGAEAADEAIRSFERARDRAGDPEDRASAELGTAHALFQSGDVREALRRYERFEKDHPEDGRASAAARRAVECLRLLGRTDDATRLATRIEREYPNSFEATLAREATRKVETKPPIEALAEELARGPFLVQVASMAEMRNAVALRRAIRGIGIDGVRIELVEGREGAVHRVLLGPYDSEDEARAIADSVAALGTLNPRVREVTE